MYDMHVLSVRLHDKSASFAHSVGFMESRQVLSRYGGASLCEIYGNLIR